MHQQHFISTDFSAAVVARYEEIQALNSLILLISTRLDIFYTLFQLVGAEANKKIADLRDWDVDTNVPESDVLMQKTNIFYFMFFIYLKHGELDYSTDLVWIRHGWLSPNGRAQSEEC